MNIAEYAIKRKVITWMIVIISLVGGYIAYQNLSRYEDPEFTIKEAKVLTHYPGATPLEVEQEVTDRVEKAIQQMPQIERITSLSRDGFSDITVVIRDKYTKNNLPQVWDELRRKVNDIQRELPPGAGPSVVFDDFGDVYGMYDAITGEGFSYRELKHYADLFKRELSLVPGVAKVVINGEQSEAIFVDISHNKMANSGISLSQIENLLKSQNFVHYSGNVKVGDEYIRIDPVGGLSSVQAIGNLLLSSPTTRKLIRLNDIAVISRGYQEVPSNLVYFNGQRALTLGISIIPGGNVVKIGEAVDNKISQLLPQIPVGIQLNPIYEQPSVVDQSIRGFMLNVIEAIGIVVAVLLLSMGLRSGIIIAAILTVTVMGTLFVMYIFGISLERISLGALIIALGMLVDNAIVVAEGVLVKSEQGIDVLTASKDIVSRTMLPLLGATVIGILAFAPIGLSQDNTGEYTRSLFYVVGISLLLSWVFAVMVTPLFCQILLKPRQVDSNQPTPELYGGFFYSLYQKILSICIRARWLTVLVLVGLLLAGGYGFTFVKQSFFPDSTTPIFYLNFWEKQGTDIRKTASDMQKIQKYLAKIPEIESVTSVVGQGAVRFMLVYSPEKANNSYGIFIIRVKDYKKIDELSAHVFKYVTNNFPNTEPKIEKVRLGPGRAAKIEARISGENSQKLREISEKIQTIMHENPLAINIRDDWRHRVKTIRPIISEQQSRNTGITKADISDTLAMAFSGLTIGLYREEDKLIPIISRPPQNERLNVASIDNVQIWSPLLSSVIPIGQVVSTFITEWENSIIQRRNRIPTITVSCDPLHGPASTLFNELRPKITAVVLPEGYKLEWGGEFEDSRDAQMALAKQMPLGFISMFVITVLLFGTLRQPLIIWLSIPLAIVGVTFGLLVTNTEFGFMALLGFLSLTGMLIKNSIVLIDQIDFEINAKTPPFQAILQASVSRVRPVVLAAGTTVLGMIPLLFDAFFASMAVVIMFGLTFATVLTLIVVPVLYAIFYKIPASS